jgi:hypothetical protein
MFMLMLWALRQKIERIENRILRKVPPADRS